MTVIIFHITSQFLIICCVFLMFEKKPGSDKYLSLCSGKGKFRSKAVIFVILLHLHNISFALHHWFLLLYSVTIPVNDSSVLFCFCLDIVMAAIMIMMIVTDIIVQLFVRFHMAPHESAPPSPQSSLEEGGESTPEEGGEEHLKPEGSEGEPPMSLVDLLGLVKI